MRRQTLRDALVVESKATFALIKARWNAEFWTKTETSADPRPRGSRTRETYYLARMAEDRRFELLRGCPQHAFQACALGH